MGGHLFQVSIALEDTRTSGRRVVERCALAAFIASDMDAA